MAPYVDIEWAPWGTILVITLPWRHEIISRCSKASPVLHSTFLHPVVLHLYPISTSISIPPPPPSLCHLHRHLYPTSTPNSTPPFTYPSRRMAVLRAPGERSRSDSVSLEGKTKICFLPCWWHDWLKMNIQGHIRNQSTVVKERKKAWAEFMRVFHSSQQQLKFKPGTRLLHLHMSGSSKG